MICHTSNEAAQTKGRVEIAAVLRCGIAALFLFGVPLVEGTMIQPPLQCVGFASSDHSSANHPYEYGSLVQLLDCPEAPELFLRGFTTSLRVAVNGQAPLLINTPRNHLRKRGGCAQEGQGRFSQTGVSITWGGLLWMSL